jgi:DNA-binding response OmpR family regulator
VYLPPAPEHKAARAEVRERRKEGAARILVVDDEPAITDLLVDILVQAGHAADGFTNPREALKALRQEQYSLALVDLQMPEMPGEALVRAIHRLPPERRPLTVILTGRLDASESRFRRLGTFAWLTKPFSNQEVLAIAERGLAARASLPRKDGE